MKLNESILAELREAYEAGDWLKFQNQIEQVLENAKSQMSQDAFLDFCDGIIAMCNDFIDSLNESTKLKSKPRLKESDIYDIAEEYEDFNPNLIISDGQIAHFVLLEVQDYDKNVDPEVFRSVVDDCCNFAAGKSKEIEDYIYKKVKETNYCQAGGKND